MKRQVEDQHPEGPVEGDDTKGILRSIFDEVQAAEAEARRAAELAELDEILRAVSPEYHLKEMRKALQSRDHQKVEQIYKEITEQNPHWLNLEPEFHLLFLRSLRYRGKNQTVIDQGETIVKNMGKNIGILAQKPDVTFDALQDAFEKLLKLLEEILYAANQLQGKESATFLESWSNNLQKMIIWFKEVTERFKRDHELPRNVFLHKINFRFEIWALRTGYRGVFFEENIEKRRDTTNILEGRVTILEHSLEKFKTLEKIDQVPPEERATVRILSDDPEILLGICEAERVLAAVKGREYEWQKGVEMVDENAAMPYLHESPTIQKWITEGIDHCINAISEGEKLEQQTLDDASQTLLRDQFLGASNRLVENLPKALRFLEGYEWFMKAEERTKEAGSETERVNIMNNFVFQNFLCLSKLLLRFESLDEATKGIIMEQAKSLAAAFGYQQGKIPTEKRESHDYYATIFLTKAVVFSNMAKNIAENIEDDGIKKHINQTLTEVLLTILEHIDTIRLNVRFPEEKSKQLLNDAWNATLRAISMPRPDEAELRYWTYLQMDAIARCLKLEAQYSKKQFLPRKYFEDIPPEAFRNGYERLCEDIAKPRSNACPPGYVEELKEKKARYKRVFEKILGMSSPTGGTDGDGGRTPLAQFPTLGES